jgi:hypothetical protein
MISETRLNRISPFSLQNITAGISSILSIFPASLRPALRTGDTIKSSVNVNEPFGLGLMLGAVYAGESVVGDWVRKGLTMKRMAGADLMALWGRIGAGFEYVEEGCGGDSMKDSTIAFV